MSIQTFYPGLHERRFGLPLVNTVDLGVPVASKFRAGFQVPTTGVLANTYNGVQASIGSVCVYVPITGSGSGTTTLYICKNEDNTNYLGKVDVAYNDTTGPYYQLDLRDAAGDGVSLMAGESISVYVYAAATSVGAVSVTYYGQTYGAHIK